MRFLADLRKFWRGLSWAGRIFLLCAIVLAVFRAVNVSNWISSLAGWAAIVSGAILTYQTIRYTIRKSIWRLRNRLLVVYLFIALVPVLLLVTLAAASIWGMSGQIAVYLATSEFDRRISFLKGAADRLLHIPAAQRENDLRQFASFLSARYPDLEIVVTGPKTLHYPSNSTLEFPEDAWKDATGVVALNGEFYGWINTSNGSDRASILVPLTREFLADLVPNLGEISVVTFDQLDSGNVRKIKQRVSSKRTTRSTLIRIPAALNRFDLEVIWASLVQVADWDQPGKTIPALFTVRSRISAVGDVLFSQKTENRSMLLAIGALAIAFLVVEVIALMIGISLSRTITSAVHELYEGTERVMEGDFAHRIHLKGRDQLAALGGSFNRMTENVERLLQVSKEKERYEAELSIAREIQAQLYPRSVPESNALQLTALYKPARMVSGDYYDYRRIAFDKIALAIGDVAGKGISAALLMATIQSAFRSRIQDAVNKTEVSTAEVVTQLNQHLHANTPPEKFATFFLAIYDEGSSMLTYTNAGHLQPILIRKGQAQRLEVDGMVIGAFPFARYGTSTIQLEAEDLLLLFTDGISEPENEYGEMFGEDRLTDLVLKNAARTDAQILSTIIEAVEKWTGSPELQDDMTLLVTRCRGKSA